MPKSEKRRALRQATTLLRLLRSATGEGDLCPLFRLTPGAVVGVLANHPKKDRDPAYRELKVFLGSLHGMDTAALMTGHCPEEAYDELNHLCQLAKQQQVSEAVR